MALEHGETDAKLVDSLGEIGGAVGGAVDVAPHLLEDDFDLCESIAQLRSQARQHHHRR
jgi:hypothetical protein